MIFKPLRLAWSVECFLSESFLRKLEVLWWMKRFIGGITNYIRLQIYLTINDKVLDLDVSLFGFSLLHGLKKFVIVCFFEAISNSHWMFFQVFSQARPHSHGFSLRCLYLVFGTRSCCIYNKPNRCFLQLWNEFNSYLKIVK